MIFKVKLYITGRGDILVLSCKDNDIDTRTMSVEEAMEKLPPIGAEVIYEGDTYVVHGIETSRLLMDPPRLSDEVGLQVKKKEDTSLHEFFDKLAKEQKPMPPDIQAAINKNLDKLF
jgi:hypothetical protein